MQTLSNRQRNHTNRSHRSVKITFSLQDKEDTEFLPQSSFLLQLDWWAILMIVQWHFLDTGRGFFIFFLVPGCLLLLVVAASIMRGDVFVHYHLLTRSFTNEGEKEGGRGIGIGYVELDANWHATLARDISICFEAVPGYLMQISGEREKEREKDIH